MEHPKTTPKDFFLWAGAMITLYGSIIAFINLLFSYINYAFPDALNSYYYSPYDSGISYWMAAFIILGASAVGLLRYIYTTIARDPSRAEIWVRRWALYLTLFIAGLTILGDLIALLNAFLSGEDITARFLLKVVVVLLVASGAFMHFLADLRGYWATEPKRANSVAIAVGIVGICTIVAGFFIIGTPWQARQVRLDYQRVSDLQNIQSQIVTYWQAKQKLPTALGDLSDSISYFVVPADPTTGQGYEYQATGATSFKLCATFATESATGSQYPTRAVMPTDPYSVTPVDPYGKGTSDNWSHGPGRECFDRTIDPDLYPPIKK